MCYPLPRKLIQYVNQQRDTSQPNPNYSPRLSADEDWSFRASKRKCSSCKCCSVKMAQEKQNANPTVYNVKTKPKRSASLGDIVDEEKEEAIDSQEVFDLIR